MQQPSTEQDLRVPYHEVFQTFEIYIDHNPDRWRGGYVWVVSQNNSELETGLCFAVRDALYSAKAHIMNNLALNSW